MKIKFQAQKPNRLRNQFVDISYDFENNTEQLYYYPDLDKWLEVDARVDLCCQSYINCRSLKAAKRKIKKWKMPKGTQFVLCSKYFGRDVYITV